jgi:hypothetical protein
MNDSKGRQTKTSIRLLTIFVVLAAVGNAIAQLPTATILGVVKDNTGAVIPETAVTARNTETGQTRTTTTNADGSYRLPALPVGPYEVRAERAGFQTAIQTNLTLVVSQEAVLNFQLQLGTIEQTISVTAEAPLVNTTTGSLGGLVGEKQIADLPLNGRNYIDLTLLQTGVSRDPVSGGSGGAMIRGLWFSSNGAGGRSNYYLIDGAAMSNYDANSSGTVTDTTLGVDGIREYRVVTNFFSAEYGMRMGSQTVIVSKSGTNSFHATAFDYLRNSVLDARNFFDYTTPNRLPAFKRNQFGGSVGGPIKKDKTFFFAVYEGLRASTGRTLISSTLPAGAKTDPNVAPIIKPFLPFFPDPNLPNNQFTFPFNQPESDNYGQLRVDHTFTANDNMFGRYTIQDSSLTLPGSFPAFPEIRGSRPQFGTLSESHIFSPTVLNTFRFSYSRTNDVGISPSALVGPQFSFIPGLPAGILNIGGVSSFGPQSVNPLIAKQNIFTYSDDVFVTRGQHSLKFGFLSNHFQTYKNNASLTRGQVNFGSVQTFLLAQPSQYLSVTPGSQLNRSFHYTTFGFYAQDDYRVTSRLTLNLGMRYEFSTVPQETHGLQANLRSIVDDAATTIGPLFQNPTLRNWSPRLGFAWDVAGNGKTAVRGGFGLLYDIGTLNAALGNSLMPPFASQSSYLNPPTLVLPFFFPPGVSTVQLRTEDYKLRQPHLLQYNLAVERQLPANMALTLAYAGSRGLDLYMEQEGNPTVPQGIGVNGVCVRGSASDIANILRPNVCWLGGDPRLNSHFGSVDYRVAAGNSWYNSLQFQLLKRMSRNLQFQSSYTWARVMDQTQNVIAGESSVPVPYPGNMKLDKAPAGFDINQNWRFNAMYQIPGFASAQGVEKVLSGWSVSGILSMQSGNPLNVLLQTNRSLSANNTGFTGTTDRPNLVPGRSADNILHGTTTGCTGVPAGIKVGTPNIWFDPCGFTVQPAGFLGNAARNMLRGPGLVNLDFSLAKDTPIRALGEGGALQFRAEFFNLLNHANFALPGAVQGDVVFAGTATGQAPLSAGTKLTQTVTTSRQIQFALKLVF